MSNTNLVNLTNKDIEIFTFQGISTYGKLVKILDNDTFLLIIQHNNEFIKLKCRLPYIKYDTQGLIARNRLIQLATDCSISLHWYSESHDDLQKIIDKNTKVIPVYIHHSDRLKRNLCELGENNCIGKQLVAEGYYSGYLSH